MKMIGPALLEFAESRQPAYFEAATDLKIYDEEEEVWKPLTETSYTLSTIIRALKTGEIDNVHVRFADSDVRKYLNHLKTAGFDDQLHHDKLMNRRRLVAFADAGYTSVEDLLGTADPSDISRETSVSRNIISKIAMRYLDGFSSGSSLESPGPLERLEPSDSFDGWELSKSSPNQIRWVSDGRFNITVSPAPDGSTTIACNAPEIERHAWYRKGRSVEAGPDDSLTPKEALEQAHEWLEQHELHYEEDLTQLFNIGLATRDYLALEYGITSKEELRRFASSQSDEFDAIFGTSGETIREELQQ